MNEIRGGRLIRRFENGAAFFLIWFLLLQIAILLALLVVNFVTKISEVVPEIKTVADLQEAALSVFSAALLILLGLELVETIKVYFDKHRVRVETILIVALIAMGRHVLVIDLHHIDPGILYGIASLILALAGGFYLVRREAKSGDRST